MGSGRISNEHSPDPESVRTSFRADLAHIWPAVILFQDND
jgi:hypothetical protein